MLSNTSNPNNPRVNISYLSHPLPFKSEIKQVGEDFVLYVDCSDYYHVPSIEDSPIYMSYVITKLVESSHITKIVFYQKRDYEYDYSQVKLLLEVAKLYSYLIKNKQEYGYSALTKMSECIPYANKWLATIQNIVYNLMRTDPIGAYVETKRNIRKENWLNEHTDNEIERRCRSNYIRILENLEKLMENLTIVKISKPFLAGHVVGTRDIYRKIFSPTIKPDFMFTKLMATYPEDGEEIDSYIIGGDSEVIIFRFRDSVKTLYHLTPPEFKLSEEKYEILDLARKILSEHKPKRSEFVEPSRIRRIFYNIGYDLIQELSNYRKVRFTDKEIQKLAEILVRYTVGFGLIEVLLYDDKIQDININSPMGRIPIFLVHGDHGDLYTNIIPTKTEADGWASKFRMISGRPLDEANPILDTELELPHATARVAIIGRPLNPTGLAFSIRRHRDRPWTLPLFIHYKMINPIAAGLFSFLIDGSRTMLICGTRSSGKTSLLTSFLVEIMRKYRIITIEDTLELPTKSLRQLGFNIQSMKVASAFTHGTSEISASDGIRTTLRLGDSALIVGEVRSKEAIALYEAMRVGAAANVVAGTIHSDSPYGVFDRVVNDIGVPRTSFKATDVIIVSNPIKSPDGLHRFRRVLQVTEVRKKWDHDPLIEGAFVDLLKYDVNKDQLIPTDDLINGDSEILKDIAAKVRSLAGSWEAVWQAIQLRAETKKRLVEYAHKTNNLELLEAPFVIKANEALHNTVEEVQKEIGGYDTKRILEEWDKKIKKAIKLNDLKLRI